ALAGGYAGRAFGFARIDIAQDAIHLRFIHLRALSRAGVEWITEFLLLGSCEQSIDQLIVNLLFNKEAGSATAGLTLVEEEREENGFRSRIEISIGKNDVR